MFISDPREKPLDRSAISLMAPNQSQTRLNQFSPDFGRESWLAPNGHLRDVECNRRCNWLSRIEPRETKQCCWQVVLWRFWNSTEEEYQLCIRNVLFRNFIQRKDVLARGQVSLENRCCSSLQCIPGLCVCDLIKWVTVTIPNVRY